MDALSSNCAKLECLCVNYCTKVSGSCLRLVLQRCKRLKSLFLAHTSKSLFHLTFGFLLLLLLLELDNKIVQDVPWEKTLLEELDIRATELDTETIISVLVRLPHLKWLDASWLEHFTDAVLEAWMQSGSLNSLQYLSVDSCDSLTDIALAELIHIYGYQLQALNLGGHHKLLEYFWCSNVIPKLKNIRLFEFLCLNF